MDAPQSVKPTGPIRELKLMDYFQAGADGMAILKMKAGSTAGLQSLEQLTERLCDWVHVNTLNATPTKLVSLNRRFGQHAVRLGSSTQEIVETLTPGVFKLIPGKQIIVLSQRALKEREGMQTPTEYMDALQNMIEGAE